MFPRNSFHRCYLHHRIAQKQETLQYFEKTNGICLQFEFVSKRVQWKRCCGPSRTCMLCQIEVSISLTIRREFKQCAYLYCPIEEAEYPLAYVLVGQRNAAQTVRLFRMIYQPQNVYCLTYDNKSNEYYKNMIHLLSDYFPGNVLVTPQPENTEYCQFSLLHSEMVCLKELLKLWNKIRWKYVQIISYNYFPLRTNRELVRIFKIFNGSQVSHLRELTRGMFADRSRPNPIPDGLTIYKGSHTTSMSKEFIEFVFTDQISIKFYKWLKEAKCQEEQYWATLIHNIHLNAPGTFPGQCFYFYDYNRTEKPWASRYEVWEWQKEKCKGKIVNYSCLFGFLDLPILFNRPEFVAHKIYEEFEPITNFCLEQWYWEKANIGIESTFNETYYMNFPSVIYHNLKDKDKFVCW